MTTDSKPDLSGDWGGKLTERGELIVPDVPAEHKALVEAIENDPGTPATVPATSAPTHDKNGRLIRPDWGPRQAVVEKKPGDWNYENDGVTERQRDPATGRYVATATASKDALAKQWAREGGSAQAIANVVATETAIVSASANPGALQAHIATLPQDIALVAADHLRLSRSAFGQDQRLSAFLDALTPAQFDQFRSWWEKLNRVDQNIILSEIGEI